jgi:hypothetical protein
VERPAGASTFVISPYPGALPAPQKIVLLHIVTRAGSIKNYTSCLEVSVFFTSQCGHFTTKSTPDFSQENSELQDKSSEFPAFSQFLAAAIGTKNDTDNLLIIHRKKQIPSLYSQLSPGIWAKNRQVLHIENRLQIHRRINLPRKRGYQGCRKECAGQ